MIRMIDISRPTLPRRTTILAAIVCALTAHGRGAAAVVPAADTDTLLRSAVVYAQPPGTMAPNQQLGGAALESLRSHSVADALRYFCGVSLKDYGGVGGLKTIDVRSMGSHHTAVFYDGLQLGNAQNGQIDLGRFSLDNIERIDLFNGQKSDLLQPARDFGSSGTVYLRSRRPTFAPDGHSHRLTASLSTGSFGLVSPTLLWEQRLGQRVTASFSSNYTHATGRYPFRYRKFFPDHTLAYDTTATRQNGDIASGRIEANIFGHARNDSRDDRHGEWHAKAYAYASQRGIPGAIVNNVWHHAQRQWDRNFFVQGSARWSFSDRYSLLASGKAAHDFLRYLNPDSSLLYVDNTFRQQESYVSLAHRLTLSPHWQLSAATDWQWNALHSNMATTLHPRRHSLLASAASRYNLGGLSLMASVLGSHIFDHSDRGATSRVRYTPAVFANYALRFPARHCNSARRQPDDHRLSLRAFWKQSQRMPTFNDLYYTDIGNAALRPELATQYDLGLLYDFSWLQLKADAFHCEVNDKIIAVPKGSGQYRWMMQNIGHVRIDGADVSLQGNFAWQPRHGRRLISHDASVPSRALSLCLNYGYQRAADRTDPTDDDPVYGTYGGQIAYVPRHSGSVTAHLSLAPFALNYSFVYVGERYHASANTRANYEQPWYTHDASLSYALRLGATRLNVQLECNNIFNQQYDVIQNYPMPGRNYRLTLRFVPW